MELKFGLLLFWFGRGRKVGVRDGRVVVEVVVGMVDLVYLAIYY